jgi:hypothetical protein
MKDPGSSSRGGPGPAGEEVPLHLGLPVPRGAGAHHRVGAELSVVAEVLQRLRPAPEPGHLVEEPDATCLPHRSGELPAKLRHATQVRRTHPVGRHVDKLTRIHVPASAEARRRILQQHGLADPPSATQHDELVVEEAVSDIIEQARAVAQVISGPGAKHLVARHPGEGISPRWCRTPPWVAITKPLAQFIIPHGMNLPEWPPSW